MRKPKHRRLAVSIITAILVFLPPAWSGVEAGPSVAVTPTPVAAPPAALLTRPVIPVVSQTARSIYRRGLRLGNDPRRFSKIGDCNSVPPEYLAALDSGAYRLGDYRYLQATVDYFAGSFARRSVAADKGFNVVSLFVPLWADPKQCSPDESPLTCEMRIHNPSLVFITMGTNDAYHVDTFEREMRRLVEYAIRRGTVPILGTKADNLEGDGAINRTIVQLAAEYDVPLWNFWLAARSLPNSGLAADGFHLTWDRDYFDDPAAMQKGWPVRNLTALQALSAVWEGVTRPERARDIGRQ